MRQIIHLYIGEQEIEFSTPPDILYNYQENDITNPTVVKNSYSKSLTVEGTPANNRIFGHFWNLERVQYNGGGDISVDFNASKKTPFKLFVNGEIYESGYVKLDKVIRKGNNVDYQITLYGGLGEFFYDLSFGMPGVDGDENKLTLADLHFIDSDTIRVSGNTSSGQTVITGDHANEFDFNLSKDALYQAWLDCKPSCSSSYLWHYINFAPAYNGSPENFSTDKALINMHGASLADEKLVDEDGDLHYYTPKNGFSLGELPSEMRETEIRDYRSYLQRPILRVNETINAISRFAEEKGWTVNLDPTFFASDNPYFGDSWMTLPLLGGKAGNAKAEPVSGLEGGLTAQQLALELTGNTGYYNMIPMVSASSIQEARFSANFSLWVPRMVTPLDSMPQTLYSSFVRKPNLINWLGRQEYYGAVFVQAVAYDANGYVCGSSMAYRLGNACTTKSFARTNYIQDTYYDPSTGQYYHSNKSVDGVYQAVPDNEDFWEGYKYTQLDGNGSLSLDGVWTRGDAQTIAGAEGRYYTFTNHDGTPITLDFSIKTIGEIATIKTYVCYCANKAKVKLGDADLGWKALFQDDYATTIPLWTSAAYGKLDVVTSKLVYTTDSNSLSNSLVTKSQLFTDVDMTPADFLLSYAKTFGLYFVKSVFDKTISIETRDTFYNRNTLIDIDRLIDRASVEITPLTFESKYYRMGLSVVDSDFAEGYEKKYNKPYGVQTINTGNKLNGETKELFSDNKFRGAVQALDTSKYYIAPVEMNFKPMQPAVYYQNFKYQLYEGDTGITETMPILKFNFTGINSRDNFDSFDKPALGADGSQVLLFFTGVRQASENAVVPYWLTDDHYMMNNLNEGPCWWLMENEFDVDGNRVAYKTFYLPRFSRYRINTNNTISRSWDFGEPEELYIPEVKSSDLSTIYNDYWKDYINDMYSIDNRVVRAKVLLEDKPNPDWLRNFYWFDNSVWRINKIIDWNISDFSTTQMEFVKVLDKQAYSLIPVDYVAEMSISGDAVIPWSGGSYTIYISDEANEGWWTSDSMQVMGAPSSGVGSTHFNITIPSNTGSTSVEWRFSIEDTYDKHYWHVATQNPRVSSEISITGATSISNLGGTYYVYVYDPKFYGWETEGLLAEMSDVTGGSGYSTVITLDIPANYERHPITYEFSVVDRDKEHYVLTLEQSANTEPSTITVTRFGGISDIPHEGGQVLMTVVSTDPWTGSTTYNYTVITPTAGTRCVEYGTTVIMTVGENTDIYQRPCIAGFVNSEGQAATLNVTQLPESLIVLSGATSVSGEGGTYEYLVRDTSLSWETNTVIRNFGGATGGTGPATLYVTYPINEGDAPITYTLAVTQADGYTSTLYVQQNVQTGITANRFAGSYDIPSEGGNALYQVISHESWTASTEYTGFISLSPTTGVGNGVVTVTMGKNINSARRTGTFTFRAASGAAHTSTLGQLGYGQITGVTITISSYTFPSGGACSLNGSVASEGNWTFTSSNWITVTPTTGASGQTVFVATATENNTGADRFGFITATSGLYSDTVHLGQGMNNFRFTGSASVPPAGGTGTYYITDTDLIGWTGGTAVTQYGGPASGVGDRAFNLSFPGNTNDGAIMYVIEVFDGYNNRHTVSTTQDVQTGITATRFGGAGDVPANGGQVLLQVNSYERWTASTEYSGYISLSPTTGTGNGVVTMTVAPNDGTSSRYCRVTFTANSGDSYIFNISQLGQGQISRVNISMDTFVFPSGGISSLSGVVTANEDWYFEKESWMIVMPVSGHSGTTNFTVTASANNTGAGRTGVLTAKASSINYSTVHLGQGAAGIDFVGPDAVGGSGGTFSYSVIDDNNIGWTTNEKIQSFGGPTGGTGYMEFELTIPANTGNFGIMHVLTITFSNYATETVYTTQDPSNRFSFSGPSSFPKAGGSFLFYIVDSDSIGWTTNSVMQELGAPAGGSGTLAPMLIVPTNTGFSPITYNLVVTDGNGVDYSINAVQSAQDSNKITYTTTDGNAITTGNTTGWGANIVSNIMYNGIGTITFDGPVTAIPDSGFSGCQSLVSINIPDEVTTIGKRAFFLNVALRSMNSDITGTTINLPQSLTYIGSSAFQNSQGWNTIIIPTGVTYIGASVFSFTLLSTIYAYPLVAPEIYVNTFNSMLSSGGVLHRPYAATGYSVWMQNADFYLGKFGWTSSADL